MTDTPIHVSSDRGQGKGRSMLFRLPCFIQMWVAITPQLWAVAFSKAAIFEKTETGFKITVKNHEHG